MNSCRCFWQLLDFLNPPNDAVQSDTWIAFETALCLGCMPFPVSSICPLGLRHLPYLHEEGWTQAPCCQGLPLWWVLNFGFMVIVYTVGKSYQEISNAENLGIIIFLNVMITTMHHSYSWCWVEPLETDFIKLCPDIKQHWPTFLNLIHNDYLAR